MDKLFEHFGIAEWAGPARGPVRALILILLCAIALKVARSIVVRALGALMRHDADDDRRRRFATVSRVLAYILTLVVSISTAMLVLAELGVSIAPLLASAGIAGVAIGFGAQSLVKDYFTGLVLLIENQIREGDVVELEGKSGSVEEVTLRYVRLRDGEGNVHFVPNGEIKVVTSKTRGYAYAAVLVQLDNDVNLDDAFVAFREAGKTLRENPTFHEVVLDDLELQGVDELTGNSIAVRARIKTVASRQWEIKREFLRLLKESLQRHQVEFPVARTTLDGALRALGPAAEARPS